MASLPEGKIFKFVPYLANIDDPPPCMDTKLLHATLRYRQQKFQETHTTSVLEGVTDLDLAVDLGSIGYQSLRQLLLSTRVQCDLDQSLFLSVDYNAYKDEITVLYYKPNSDEANTLVRDLPVYLEAKYGISIWAWFSPEQKSKKAHLHWNSETHQVEGDITLDDDLLSPLYVTGSLAAWEVVDELNLPTSTPVTVDISLLFDMTPRTRYEGFDDNGSAGTHLTNTSQATTTAAVAPPDIVLTIDSADSPTAGSSLTSNGSAPAQGASSQGAGVNTANG